jgi:hypothetical protein
MIGRVAALVVAGLALAGPAAADEAPVWQDAGAAVPAGVTFNAVAANGTSVVAVGADGPAPVAYRLAGGAWQRTVLAPEGFTGAAVDVAIDQFGAGWAVGWQQPADGPAQALLQRLGTDGLWSAIATTAGPLTAVGATADVAYAGDGAGAVLPVSLDGLGPAITSAAPGSVTAIRSLALTAGLSAIAGGAPASGAPASTALLDVDGASSRMTPASAVPADAGPEIVAVSALPDGQRIAVDGTPCGTPAAGTVPAAWRPDASTGAWRRDAAFPTTTGTRLCDTALTAGGDALVAGSFSGRRAVWRRSTSWTLVDTLGAGELRGVAATPDGAWAVGTGGTVLRFAPVPPPTLAPEPQPEPAPPVAEDDPPPAPEKPRDEPAAPEPAPQPAAEPRPVVDVTIRTEPAPHVLGQRAQRAPVKRLLSGLAVRRLGGHRLRMNFRLRLPARLTVRALRGERVVATASRRLGRGTHELILPYRGGKAPTRLDIVVRRQSSGASKGDTR